MREIGQSFAKHSFELGIYGHMSGQDLPNYSTEIRVLKRIPNPSGALTP